MKSKLLLLTTFLIFSCSKNPEFGQSLPPEPEKDAIITINTADIAQPDTYADDCYGQVYYYCPPLDETWRAIAIIDTCDGDKIVEMGPCEQVLECDPTDDVEVRECWTERGAKGFQNVYCSKGFYEYGECVPCDDEICDGIDNWLRSFVVLIKKRTTKNNDN